MTVMLHNVKIFFTSLVAGHAANPSLGVHAVLPLSDHTWVVFPMTLNAVLVRAGQTELPAWLA